MGYLGAGVVEGWTWRVDVLYCWCCGVGTENLMYVRIINFKILFVDLMHCSCVVVEICEKSVLWKIV